MTDAHAQIHLDARKEYEQVRADLGMLPHDARNPRDTTIEGFFLSGYVRGLDQALRSIREQGEKVSRL